LFALFLASSAFQSRSLQTTVRRSHQRERSQRLPGYLGTDSQSLFQPSAFSFSSEKQEQLSAVEEDPDGRSDWFMFQRLYPSGSIPRDARLKARQALPRFQTDTVAPQAVSVWHSIGPSPTTSFWSAWGMTSGRVNAVAVSPANSRVVIVGSATGGLWRSTDAGDNFVPVSDDQVDLEVGSLAFSKVNPSIVYAGMGDAKGGYLGSGVLKSTDEGLTWSRVSNNTLPSPGTISKLELDPANPNSLYVAQYSMVASAKVTSSGVYQSTDGGVSWTRMLAGAARDVLIDPANSQTVYAGLSRIDQDADPPFGLYRSTDAGSSWTALFTATYDLTKRRDIRVAISPVDTRRAYIYYGGTISDNLDAHLKGSTDSGATWSEISLASVDTAQIGYNTYLIADPRDPLTVYLGSRDVYRSTDGGASWKNLTQNFYQIGGMFNYAPGGSTTHTDQHAIAFSPTSSNEFYVGNDGGVSKTTDGGSTFRSLNSTLTLTQFVGMALNPLNPLISYGGTQDNGTQQRSGSSNWREIVSGDGGHVVINPINPSVVFTTYVRGDVYRLGNDGQSLDAQIGSNGTFGEPTVNPRIAFYPPFCGNGIDATVYFGTWRLFISNDLGNSWQAPAGSQDLTKGITDKGKDVLSAIGVARSNTSVIYTGSAQGRVMMSSNRGGNWTDITAGLPDRSITSITVDPGNPAVAYLTVSGFNSGHVFLTTNSGATWTSIGNGLPDIPADVLLIDPSNSDTLYLGTDIGVFRSTTRGASWESFNVGMPPVVIHDLVAHSSGLIQAATYGRGAFELGGSAPTSPPSISSVSFNGVKRLTIDGSGFGASPSVIINGANKNDYVASTSDTSIVVTGKTKKLGLKSGDNTVQVITSDNVASNVFMLKL
jgi:photosystem II stability/assembly factor-like uncharacterized protein